MPSPFYPASVVLFMLHRGMSHMQVLATPSSTVNNTNAWILTTETILDLAACSRGSEDVASGADRYLDITFGLQVVESSSLLSVLFREEFSHPYISFSHLLVNGFSVTCLPPFF